MPGLTERDEFVDAVWAELRAADHRWTEPNIRRAMDAVSLRLDAGADVADLVSRAAKRFD